MSGVPYRMWAGYWRLLIEQQGLHPKRVLDVCCGTGTLTELLARDGYEMAGIDISAPMLEEARASAARRKLTIRYLCADACCFEMDETFDAAFSFFDSLNYITSSDYLQQAIERVAAHVDPGGSFIFDLNTAYAFEKRMFDQSDLRQSSRLNYQWTGEYDASTLMIRVQMDFWVDGERFSETHWQRAHPLDEVQGMLERAGFGDIRLYDSYTLNRVRKKSDRVHFAAIRL